MEDFSHRQEKQYHIHIKIKQQALMKNVRALLFYQRLVANSRVIQMEPSYDVIEHDVQFTGVFNVTVTTSMDQMMMEQQLQMPDIEELIIVQAEEEGRRESTITHVQTVARSNMQLQENIPLLLSLPTYNNAQNQPPFVAVAPLSVSSEVNRTKMLKLVEELVIDQSRLVTVNQCMTERSTQYAKDHIEQLQDITHHLQRVISELQVSVADTYKRPVAQMFEPIQAFVQQHTTFDLFGGDVTLEDELIQYLQPPLHAFFTAIVAQPVAYIAVTAAQIDHEIRLTIDVHNATYEALQLQMTALMEAINTRGTSRVMSESHIIQLQLSFPLTTSIMSALLIEFAHERCVVPLTYVTEIIRIPTEDIQLVGEREVSIIRGQLLPLVRMSEQLQLRYTKQRKKREIVIVVTIGNRHVGLIVDKMLSKQEVVMKPLSAYLGTPPYIAGATIIGNGDVAMIIDVLQVLDAHGATFEQQEKTASTTATEQLVTFMLHDTEYGIVIDRVEDIIPVQQLRPLPNMAPLQVGIIDVQQQTVPLVSVHTELQLDRITVTPSSRAIVTTYEGRRISLFVDEVTAVLNVESLTIAPIAAAHYHYSRCIKDVCHVDGRTILLLDFDYLLNEVYTTL